MIIDRMKLLALWRSAHITPTKIDELKAVGKTVMSFQSLYLPVEKATGVPWYVIGAIDSREENFNHSCYLGNGDSLHRPTHHVPKGRGPFANWSDGAIDALKLDGMAHLPEGHHWDIVTALTKCESFNGMGYASKGLPSPYVWGATNIQRAGKYIADGHWSADTWDVQVGCAAIFLALKEFHGVDLREA